MYRLLLYILVSIAAVSSQCYAQKSRSKPFTAYLFVYFINNSPEGEQVRFAISRDGFNYIPLNNGERVIDLDTVARWKSVRDPHILRAEDGKTFYMVATDMRSSVGWASNDGLVMMKSKDLINWNATAIDFPTVFPHLYNRDSLTNVWAPQTIYDKEKDKYMVYYSLGRQGRAITIYYSYANKDFTSLSEPKQLVFVPDIIDADIVEHEGKFHMFLAGIWKSEAPSLMGPWSKVNKEKKYQQTDKAAEGPAIFKRNNSDDWILMYDCFHDGYYQFCQSKDLEHFSLIAQTSTKGKFTPRHGTVIGITEQELERLIKAFPSDGLKKDALSSPESAGNHDGTIDKVKMIPQGVN